jgi:TRAP-type C4-dicarboxylate transport system permease small subunit
MKRFLENIVEWASMGFVVALAVVVFLQVFNRFVLKAPLAWSEDLAMLLFQWVVFLGAAIGVRRLRHFGIDLVVKKLPVRMHRTIALMVPWIVGIVALTMITEGLHLLTFNRARIYATMDLSYLWAYLPIPVSGCLMILYLVLQEIQRWKEPGSHNS